jgi:hypothetical protein
MRWCFRNTDFWGLAVLDIEQNPVLQSAQEVARFEERLHRKSVGFLTFLLPARHEAPVGVPGQANQ